MKKLFLLFLPCFVFFISCDEIAPVVNPVVASTDGCDQVKEENVADQQKQVLIEEFTGVRCVFCPAGSEAIEGLLDLHGDRLIAISYHTGIFSTPYDESVYDFRTQGADDVINFLGQPIGFPTAVVSRKQFTGEDSRQIGRSSWASYIENELQAPLQVKLDLVPSYDTADRKLKVSVGAFFQTDVNVEDLRLSVLLTEDDISDYQLTPDGKQSDYIHRHAFRKFFTNSRGNSIQESTTAGSNFCQSFELTLNEEYKPEKCKIIAFLHNGAGDLDVIQVAQIKALP